LTNADAEHLFIHPGPYKKITHAIRAMDTEAEGKWVSDARNYIGAELFDSLLRPAAVSEWEADPLFQRLLEM
jgi:hypothetical protein